MKANQRRRLAVLMLGAVLALPGCGGSSGGSQTATGPSLSGTLSSTQSFRQLTSIIRPFGQLGLESSSASSIACVTAGSSPVKIVGTVAAAGSFDIDLSSVPGQPVTCTILDSASDILGTFVFENPAATAFNGKSQATDTVVISGPTNVGLVSLSGGQISINAPSVGINTAGTSLTAAEAFDPTGIWTLGTVSFTLPPGYVGPCASGDASCHGPTVGGNLYLLRVDGKTFTPDSTCTSAVQNNTFNASSTCAGTTAGQDAFALTIWMAQQTFQGCGSKLGFTFDQAKAYAGIDFTGQAVAGSGAYQWSTSAGTDTIVNGWEDTAATSSWEMDACTSASLGGQNAWKCLDSAGTHYSVSLGGGCVDGGGNPVQPDDWSHVSYSGGCSSTPVTLGGLTLSDNECPATYTPGGTGTPESLTCGGIWGAFNVSDNSSYTGSFTNQQIIAQNGTCASADTSTDAGKLAQLQCYANYFWQNVQSQARSDASLCLKQIQTNWAATSSTDFIQSTGPDRAINEALTEKLTYLNADTAVMTQLNDNYPGIQVQSSTSSSWVACHTVEKDSIVVAHVSNNQLIVRYTAEVHLADTKDACIAAASDTTSSAYQQLQLGVTRMMFELTK